MTVPIDTAEANMINLASIDLDRVLRLYEQYAGDLARVRRYQRLLYEERFSEKRARANAELLLRLAADMLLPAGLGHVSWAQFDDLSAEITYLLLRDERPEVVVEISPCGGWSTSWILNALRDSGCGRLVSFDVIDDSVVKVPADLSAGIRTFHLGDVRQSPHIPARIDYLFVDSDHTGPFAKWYVQNVFPRVRSGAVVSVDDVYHDGGPAISGGEGPVVLDWLERRGIEYLTIAPSQNRAAFDAVVQRRRAQGIETNIHFSGTNPALWFVMP
ncbi:MAG: class I SAM-dependent methyltransferase [Planctomycetota bacterium]